MKRLILLLACCALSGCETLSKMLENDVACAPNWQDAYFVSMYGPIGPATKVKKESAQRICEALVLRQIMLYQQAQQQKPAAAPAGWSPEDL